MCAKTWDSRNPSKPADAPDQRGEEDSRRGESDARETLQQLAAELRRAVLDVAWRQWRSLGAGAVAPRTTRTATRAEREAGRDLRALVDPEALVLISLVLLQEERRLGDLVHDWGARNSDLLSVQRVKNLEADYPEPVRGPLTQRLAWFATVARDAGKDLRWRSLAQGRAEEEGRGLDTAGEAGARARGVHAPGSPDGASTKSRATRARLTADATLLLRLRLGLGVGVKADLLAFLLARVEEWATVRDVANAIGYTVAAVRRAADDLAAARLIEALEGQPAGYRATYGAWAPLLGFEDRPPRWGSWHERFVFAAAFVHWAGAARERPLSAYAFGAHGRQLLERHRPAFERDLVAVWSEHSPVPDWGAFVGRSVRSLAAWMAEMA